jgi:hypothetical protein
MRSGNQENDLARPAVTVSDVAQARQRGLAFFKAEQGDKDHCPIQLFHPERPDRTVFSSSYAALALSVDPSAESLEIRRKLVRFIRSQKEWPGLWRYWGRGALVPCDLDDCSLGQIVLRLHGESCLPIDWLLALHQRPEGMFLAWMIPGNVRTLNPLYWLLCLRECTPRRLHFRFFGLWTTSGKSHCQQYHVISNTHIVHCLGDTPTAASAIDWIIDTVRRGLEFEREVYYRDPEFLYLGMGRAFRGGVTRFGEVAGLIERRLAENATPEGRIGGSAFTTAAACAALLHLGWRSPLVDSGIRWLVSTQAEDGGWPGSPLDHDGPPPSITGWGSRALTTAVVIEALALQESSIERLES